MPQTLHFSLCSLSCQGFFALLHLILPSLKAQALALSLPRPSLFLWAIETLHRDPEASNLSPGLSQVLDSGGVS